MPDLATVHSPLPARHARVWVPVVLGALLVNAGLLAIVLWYRASAPAPAPATAQGPAAAASAPSSSALAPGLAPGPRDRAAAPDTSAPPPPPAGIASGPRRGGSPAETVPEARSAPSTPEAPPAPPAPTASPAPAAPPAPIAPEPSSVHGPSAPAQGVATAAPASAATRAAPRPSLPADLPPSFREAVARLRLEALVYAETPAERKVFISGRKYVEGESIDGSIVVEKIIEEGAVLGYLGHRYVLRHFR